MNRIFSLQTGWAVCAIGCAMMAFGLSVGLSGCGEKPRVNPPVIAEETPDHKMQTVTIAIDNGYRPDQILARPGLPIALVFVNQEKTPTCAQDIEVPVVQFKGTVGPHQTKTVEIPAQDEGAEVVFRCQMDMMRGFIRITDHLE